MTLRQEAIQNLQVALYDYNRKPSYKQAQLVEFRARLLLKLAEVLAFRPDGKPWPKRRKHNDK